MTRWVFTVSASLLVCLMGCEPQRPAEASKARAARVTESTAIHELKPTSLLVETNEGFFGLPWLTLENVEQHVAELNRRDITRIELHHRGASWSQSSVLRQLCLSCPNLTAVSIRNWTFSASVLQELLLNLPRLQQLDLSSCRLTTDAEGDTRSDFEWNLKGLGLTQLSLSSCHGIDNELVTRLLTAMPVLEELLLSDGGDWTGVAFDGRGWPLNKLPKLRKLAMASSVDDAFISRVLSDVANLKSLELWECNKVQGLGWAPDQLAKIEELGFFRCENISTEALSALLQHTPQLRSLQLQQYDDVDEAALDLAPCSELRELQVNGYRWQGVASCRQLESLSISIRQSVEESELNLSPLTRLKTLSIDAPGDGPLASLPPSIESLHLRGGSVSNSSIALLLKRLINLRSLHLASVYGGQGYETDREAITGAGWDFTAQNHLTQLYLDDCDYITDRLVSRVAEQVPTLEALRIRDGRYLTGRNWGLYRWANLKRLELHDLPQLKNVAIHELPESLESLKIRFCDELTGESWNLASLPNLAELEIRYCGSLKSIGNHLPASLQSLQVVECRQLKGGGLSYFGLSELETLNFRDCRVFDVDRLFEDLPGNATSLRRLNLTGCPNLASADWDLSPLKNTLREISYAEGEPSYVGGIDEAKGRKLRQQLPNTRFAE